MLITPSLISAPIGAGHPGRPGSATSDLTYAATTTTKPLVAGRFSSPSGLSRRLEERVGTAVVVAASLRATSFGRTRNRRGDGCRRRSPESLGHLLRWRRSSSPRRPYLRAGANGFCGVG